MTNQERLDYIAILLPYLSPQTNGATRIDENHLQILKTVYKDIFQTHPRMGCCAKPFLEILATWYDKNKPAELPAAIVPEIPKKKKKGT